jgi:hypothetical protein
MKFGGTMSTYGSQRIHVFVVKKIERFHTFLLIPFLLQSTIINTYDIDS